MFHDRLLLALLYDHEDKCEMSADCNQTIRRGMDVDGNGRGLI